MSISWREVKASNGIRTLRRYGERTLRKDCELWKRHCSRYLPIHLAGTFWRVSRETRPEEPTQGWKLHISATAPQACDVFEAVAPLLMSRDVRFKAPHELIDIVDLNSGLKHGYSQVGKVITVYPPSPEEAVDLAAILDELTLGFISISVPFDNQYSKGSNVFYRYGRFLDLEMQDPDGGSVPAVRHPSGELVYDDNHVAVPEWIPNPFPVWIDDPDTASPLTTTYRVFQAITQRGKGGTYRAIDTSTSPPRLCVIKQGRRFGEMGWDGQDGYALAAKECKNLIELAKGISEVPTVLGSFESEGNFYVAMEHIEGPSLHRLMMVRKRRFSISQVLDHSIEAARVVEKINRAGWIWNDCKPGNLIVTKSGAFRPVDFENAHRASESASFNWSSRGYSSNTTVGDGFALGAMIYMLLTGRFYDREINVPIRKLRRNVPGELELAVEKLLRQERVSIPSFRKTLESLRRQFKNTAMQGFRTSSDSQISDRP